MKSYRQRAYGEKRFHEVLGGVAYPPAGGTHRFRTLDFRDSPVFIAENVRNQCHVIDSLAEIVQNIIVCGFVLYRVGFYDLWMEWRQEKKKTRRSMTGFRS